MHKGKLKIPIEEGATVLIKSTGEFSVLGYDGVRLLSIIGPRHVGDRQLQFVVPQGVTSLEVICKPAVRWSIDVTRVNGKEVPDPTPVALPVGHHHPPTLREDMQRFIREEVSRHYQEAEGAGSFEEEDDFDVDDDDEFVSPYEMSEMIEEEPMPKPQEQEAPPAQPESAEEAVDKPEEPANV